MKSRELIRNKLFLQYLISYVAIFLIPFAIFCGLIYQRTNNLAQQNSRNFYNNKLFLLQTNFDIYVSDMESIKQKVEYSKWLQDVFFTRVAEKKELDGILYNKILQEMKFLSISNLKINSIYIKFDEDDTVYSNSGIYKNYTYTGVSSLDKEDVLCLSRQASSDNGFTIKRNITTKKGKGNYIIYSTRITNFNYIGAVNRQKGNLVVVLELDPILSQMSGLLGDNGFLYYVEDPENGKVILSNKNETGTVSDWQSGLVNSTATGSYIQISGLSPQSGLKYCLFIPKLNYVETISYIKNSFACFSLMALFICIALSIILAWKNFDPIFIILKKLTGTSNHMYNNSLRFINESISKIMQEKSVLQQELDIHKPYMQQHLLKCLIEPEGSEITKSDVLEKYDITFHYPLYAVVLAEIPSNYTSSSNFDSRFVYMVVFKKVIRSLLTKSELNGYILDININKIALLMNIKSSKDLSRFANELSTESCVTSDKNDLPCYPTIAIGGCHNCYNDFQRSYLEALEALKYKLLEGVGSVIFYDDIKDTISGNYHYSISDEISLITSIQEGNLNNSLFLLERISKEIIFKQDLSVYSAKCVYYELAATIAKAAKQLGLKYEEFIDYKQLESLETLFDIFDYLKSSLNLLNEKLKQKNENGISQNDINIINHVENNCFDCKLSQQLVSLKFGVSASYVSLVFKKKFGISYLEFVNKKRIEKALDLMKSHQYKLCDIYHEIGYDSANTFRRNFIKYTGLKPAEYRK